MRGPVILVSNLLTEGRGMWHFTAGEAVREMARSSAAPSTSCWSTPSRPSDDTLERYSEEHKRPLPIGDVPANLRGRHG